ncbi:YceD family protein [Chitinivorax sp. B]|uniref:YceD family protein n=1 Tax=Chitinivorax sp. B TaxID=2502235 RepID=UPI0010F9BF24|nr:YceD family protein [Chitinivorax sp. B]
MSDSIFIDSEQFARDGQHLTGSVAVADLARLHDQLIGTDGNVTYELLGGTDLRKRGTLTLRVVGSVQQLCQRCLQAMDVSINTDVLLTLFPDEQAIEIASSEEPDIEGIVASKRLDVVALVEDEVLLSLPLAPRHDVCRAAGDTNSRSDKPNPFAVLKQLKQSK